MARPRRTWKDWLLRLPPDLHAALAARSKLEDRSMAAIARTAIRRYLTTPLPPGARERPTDP